MLIGAVLLAVAGIGGGASQQVGDHGVSPPPLFDDSMGPHLPIVTSIRKAARCLDSGPALAQFDRDKEGRLTANSVQALGHVMTVDDARAIDKALAELHWLDRVEFFCSGPDEILIIVFGAYEPGTPTARQQQVSIVWHRNGFARAFKS